MNDSRDEVSGPARAFVRDRVLHFLSESRRLSDRSVLDEYRSLVMSLESLQRKLGTLEHEAALAELKSEVSLARGESKKQWAGIWRSFGHLWEVSRDLQLQAGTLRNYAKEDRLAAQEFLDNTEEYGREYGHVWRGLRDTASGLEKTADEVSRGLWKGPILVLLLSLWTYRIYLRYLAARLLCASIRHSFIIVVSVLLVGVLFSYAASAAASRLASVVPSWSWLAAGLTVAALIMRKYYIEPRIRKLQIRMERRWFLKIAWRLHMVRVMALVSRTASRPSANVG